MSGRPTDWGDTYVGVLECDVLLGAVDSLKHKRAIIRPIVNRLRRLEVAVTESGDCLLYTSPSPRD